MQAQQETLQLLQQVQSGQLRPEEALLQLKLAPFEDLGYAKIDSHRPIRQGAAEVIYGAGKTPEQIAGIAARMAERGVACNVHYKPLPMMTAYKAMGFDIADYPNAYHHYENLITLPLHTRLSDEDAAYVTEQFADIVKEYLR